MALPLRHPRWTFGWAAALGLYYLLTMSGGISFFDSPEIALVAEQLGLGHPPGQPLHTMLGWLWLKIFFFTTPVWALNAFSAVCAALTLVAVVSFAEALAETHPAHEQLAYPILPPTLALLGMHNTLWEPATRIEVYSLATLFAVSAIAILCRTLLSEPHSIRSRTLFSAGLGFGFSASTNPIIAIASAVAAGPRLLIALARRELRIKQVGIIVAGGLTGLLPYLYVPLIALRGDAIVWGKPTDAESLRFYFSGGDFAKNVGIDFATWRAHFGMLLQWMLQNGMAALVALGFLGLTIFSAKRGLGRLYYWLLWFLLLGFVAGNIIFALDVPDYLGYLATPLWLAAGGTALLIAYFASQRRSIGLAAVLGLFALVLLSQPPPYARTRHLDRFVDELAANTLRAAPPNAILVMEVDHWVGPLWHAQEHDKLRPDVVVVFYGLASSGWYWERLFQQHPELKEFALLGPGGRRERVQRFLVAQGPRPLLFESSSLAATFGVRACPGHWLLHATHHPQCEDPPVEGLEAFVDEYAQRLGLGSPGTEGILATIAYERARSIWVSGADPARAANAALRGLPTTQRPALISPGTDKRDPEGRPLPSFSFRDPVATGSAARNLFVAAWMLEAGGRDQDAAQLLRMAAALGLHEAKLALGQE